MSPGAFDMKMCSSSVEPMPSRMSTPKRAFQAMPDGFRQRLAGRRADAQPRACPRVLARLVVEHRRKQRRRAVEDRRIVLVEQREHQRRRRPVGIEHRAGADGKRERQRIAEAVGEEQFRRGEADVVLADAEHLLGIGVGGGLQARMQMPHALGHAGRARRVEPERRLVGMGLDGLEAVALALEFVRQQLVAERVLARDDDAVEIAHPPDDVFHDRKQRLGDEQHARAAVGEDVGVLLRRQQRVERHRHDAGADRAQKHDREIDGVEHDHGDALFAAHAEPAQHVGGAAALLLQIAIGEFGRAVGIGELVAAPLLDIAVEQPRHRIVGRHTAPPLNPHGEEARMRRLEP